MEIGLIKNGIIYALNNLEKWVKPEKTTPLSKAPLFSTFIENQPYGVVLVIGAWNYPYQVCLVPLVGAIARLDFCAYIFQMSIFKKTFI
jgi:acyl-CoA reductase-like NAD-dependent aldehyde dehydrogenase